MTLKAGIIWGLTIAFGIYALLVVLMYFIQDRIIFLGTRIPPGYTFPEFPNAEEVYLQSPDGVQLHALYFQTKQAKGNVLYFHGNAGSLTSWGYAAEDFTRRGYNVLMPDYRNYGKSQGRIVYEDLCADALLFYHYIMEQSPDQPLILYGRSLGTGLASYLATKIEAQQLILETPYTSIADMAKINFGFLPVDWLLKYPLNNDQNLTKVKCPFHLLHGTKDELIPYGQARQLAQLFPNDPILTTIPGGGHNNLSSFNTFQTQLSKLLP